MATVERKTYYKTAIALFALLGLTLAVSYLPLGPFTAVVGMTIAIAKALLIIMFFMHVRYAGSLVTVFAVAGFLWLILLFGTLGDYVTRFWLPLTTWGA